MFLTLSVQDSSVVNWRQQNTSVVLWALNDHSLLVRVCKVKCACLCMCLSTSPPVFGVWWPLLQPHKCVACCAQGQPAYPITPLFLSPVTSQVEPKLAPTHSHKHTQHAVSLPGPPHFLKPSHQVTAQLDFWHQINQIQDQALAGRIKLEQSLCHIKCQKSSTSHSPPELDILVDTPSNCHGNNGIIPRTDEHERETQTHAQEWQSPAETEEEWRETYLIFVWSRLKAVKSSFVQTTSFIYPNNGCTLCECKRINVPLTIH